MEYFILYNTFSFVGINIYDSLYKYSQHSQVMLLKKIRRGGYWVFYAKVSVVYFKFGYVVGFLGRLG